ncbi:putative disease resistance protein rga3 [Nicotiana attenuata]|uniref:Disease resistance protein rga3 n=1 Tax=Nicotiana attenuata TaxID=49451 RepID=A0A1J6K626_NICAT|nr:putative disease resistance protein rga3 [Nicotiana attenuata]
MSISMTCCAYHSSNKSKKLIIAVYKMCDLIHYLGRSVGSKDFEMLGHDLAQGNMARVCPETLPLYIVGKGIGESITEISCLNLRGELRIRCLENIRDKEESTLANLRAKKYVELLSLQWGSGNEEKIVKLATGSTSYEVCREVDGTSRSLQRDNDIVVECILECLHPHVNLKKLYIKGYPGFKFPDWDLHNLVLIVLINCRGCDTLPTLGKLPFLKTLCLQGMDGVTHIGEEFCGVETLKFPSLEELTIRDLPA